MADAPIPRERLRYLALPYHERIATELKDRPYPPGGLPATEATPTEDCAMARWILARLEQDELHRSNAADLLRRAADPASKSVGYYPPCDVGSINPLPDGSIQPLDATRDVERVELAERLEQDAQLYVAALLPQLGVMNTLGRPGDLDILPSMAFAFARAMERYRCAALVDAIDEQREEAARG